jgi:replicative DNA helicase
MAELDDAQHQQVPNTRRKPNTSNAARDASLSSLVFGKVQPQAVEVEAAVLGAIMLDKDALPVVIDVLSDESFYTDAHRAIYMAMKRLFERSQPIDLLTTMEELKKSGELELAGGAYYLVELTNRVASAANIEHHARIVAQKFIQRSLIKISTNIIKDAYEDTTDVFDLLDKAEQSLFSIAEQNLNRNFMTMSTLAFQVQKQLKELAGRTEGLTGIPSGFSELDRITSGWQRSDLIIVAARPAMGKTSFTLALAMNAAADFGKGVAFFSLEMSSVQLAQRLISMQAEVSATKMRNASLEPYEWEQLNASIERVSELPIFIDDTPGLDIFELRAKCRRLKMQHDIQLIIIDYLQLMKGNAEGTKGGNREQEISSISRALKGLAKELSVPVIALSQLSRAVETRGGNKRPQLSDLRESGAIEQDADIVSFIYRPEYYEIMEDENGNSTKGVAEIILAKHRNGATGTARLKFTNEFAKFGNLEYDSFDSFPTALPAGISTITMGSKMNHDIDNNSVPF